MSSSQKNDTKPQPIGKWVDAGNGWIPTRGSTAIIGGFDVSGEHLYVGRSDHQNQLIVGKVNCSHGVCYCPYNGLELAKNNYQVLAQLDDADTEFEWVEQSNGGVPSNAIQGGVEIKDNQSIRIFIGRVKHENSLVIGKVHPQNGLIYIPFAGREIFYDTYEVLCVKRK